MLSLNNASALQITNIITKPVQETFTADLAQLQTNEPIDLYFDNITDQGFATADRFS